MVVVVFVGFMPFVAVAAVLVAAGFVAVFVGVAAAVVVFVMVVMFVVVVFASWWWCLWW